MVATSHSYMRIVDAVCSRLTRKSNNGLFFSLASSKCQNAPSFTGRLSDAMIYIQAVNQVSFTVFEHNPRIGAVGCLDEFGQFLH